MESAAGTGTPVPAPVPAEAQRQRDLHADKLGWRYTSVNVREACPAGRARYGAGAGCSAMKHQSLRQLWSGNEPELTRLTSPNRPATPIPPPFRPMPPPSRPVPDLCQRHSRQAEQSAPGTGCAAGVGERERERERERDSEREREKEREREAPGTGCAAGVRSWRRSSESETPWLAPAMNAKS